MCIALGCKKLKAQTEMGVWHRFRRNSAFEFEEFELRVRRVQVSSSKILSFGLESQTLKVITMFNLIYRSVYVWCQ